MQTNPTSLRNYPTFGSVMPGREYANGAYRFGFNGQEKDSDFGETYTFNYRIHDVRLGRFLSVDPLFKNYCNVSNYAFCENRVIDGIELEGLERVHYRCDQADGVTFSFYVSNFAPTGTAPAGVTSSSRQNTITPGGGNMPATPSVSRAGASVDANNAVASLNPARQATVAGIAANVNAPATGVGVLNDVPNQFNQGVLSQPAGGSVPGGPTQNYSNGITNLINATPAPGAAATTVLAQNTTKILIVTNGTAAANLNAQNIVGNPAIGANPATGLMATHPNVQFEIASDPMAFGGLNNDQAVLFQNPTVDFVTAGNPANVFNLNLTVVTPWSNSRGTSSPQVATTPATPTINPTVLSDTTP